MLVAKLQVVQFSFYCTFVKNGKNFAHRSLSEWKNFPLYISIRMLQRRTLKYHEPILLLTYKTSLKKKISFTRNLFEKHISFPHPLKRCKKSIKKKEKKRRKREMAEELIQLPGLPVGNLSRFRGDFSFRRVLSLRSLFEYVCLCDRCTRGTVCTRLCHRVPPDNGNRLHGRSGVNRLVLDRLFYQCKSSCSSSDRFLRVRRKMCFNPEPRPSCQPDTLFPLKH